MHESIQCYIIYCGIVAVTNKPDGETWVRLPSDEEKLLQALFADYKPSARPVMNSSNTVNVNIQFSLMHIKDLVGNPTVRGLSLYARI